MLQISLSHILHQLLHIKHYTKHLLLTVTHVESVLLHVNSIISFVKADAFIKLPLLHVKHLHGKTGIFKISKDVVNPTKRIRKLGKR